jgi:hypothetical protein
MCLVPTALHPVVLIAAFVRRWSARAADYMFMFFTIV